MFLETVTGPPGELDEVLRVSGLLTMPAPGLRAYVSWEAEDGGVSAVMAWDSPAARGDFAEQVMMPLLASGALSEVSDPSPVRPRHVLLAAPPSGDPEPTRPFIDTTRDRAADEDEVLRLNRMLTDPPAGLLAYLSWEVDDADSRVVLVWDSPAARGDWSETVMMPLFASGQMDGLSGRLSHPRPAAVWVST